MHNHMLKEQKILVRGWLQSQYSAIPFLHAAIRKQYVGKNFPTIS